MTILNHDDWYFGDTASKEEIFADMRSADVSADNENHVHVDYVYGIFCGDTYKDADKIDIWEWETTATFIHVFNTDKPRKIVFCRAFRDGGHLSESEILALAELAMRGEIVA